MRCSFSIFYEVAMIRILRQIFRTGIVTEPLQSGTETEIPEVGAKLEEAIRRRFRRSLTIRQVDAGSCNGCELEIHGMNNPIYNCERFGMHFTASPRFADMLLVTGPVTKNMEIALRRTYEATPQPKLVVAVGDCGCNGGIFGESYASLGGVDRVIPVDAYIPGCPPSPTDLLNGILKAIS
jgi:Ni,Fe-hydrogenase III small subunit